MNAKESVIAKIKSTAVKTQSAREAKQKKGTATGYVSVWNDAVLELYGKDFCVAPTQKTLAMVKRAMARLSNQSPVHLKMFVNYCVEEWATLGIKTQALGKKWPEHPDLKIFVYAIDKLYFEYCRKDQSKVRSAPSKKAVVDDKVSKLEAEVKSLRSTIEKRDKEIAQLKVRIGMMTGK